jgi:hypothetical protein
MLLVYFATAAGLPAAVAPATVGADALVARRLIIAASFEDRTAMACAAMLEAPAASFKAPPMASP